MQLGCVDPATVSKIWPLVKPLVVKALNRTAISPADSSKFIESEILSGCSFLWLAHDDEAIWAAITMKITGDHCELMTCGGLRVRPRPCV